LLRITKDSRYGDSMERVLYNTILGAKPTLADGSTFYYSDYHKHGHKVYRGEAWPCCSGTFIQLTADYGISAYLFDDQNLYVNLYAPSNVSGALVGEDITVTQTTEYPLSHTSSFALTSRAQLHSAFACASLLGPARLRGSRSTAKWTEAPSDRGPLRR
jgi:DUF1680 family protein